MRWSDGPWGPGGWFVMSLIMLVISVLIFAGMIWTIRNVRAGTGDGSEDRSHTAAGNYVPFAQKKPCKEGVESREVESPAAGTKVSLLPTLRAIRSRSGTHR